MMGFKRQKRLACYLQILSEKEILFGGGFYVTSVSPLVSSDWSIHLSLCVVVPQ